MKYLLRSCVPKILLLMAAPILPVSAWAYVADAAADACTKVNPTLFEPPVYAVAFSPDGKILASTYKKSPIRLWDVETRRPRADLRGHPDKVLALAFTPDGKKLISGSDGDGPTVKVWDLPSGMLRHTLLGHLDGVVAVAVSPDGRVAASAGADSIIRLWDLQTGKLERKLQGHKGVIMSVAFSRDGYTLASAARPEDERVEGILLWDARQGTIRSRLVPTRPFSHVTYSPDGKLLAATEGWDRGQTWVQVYEVHTQRLVREVGYNAASIAFSPDARTLAIGRYRHMIWMWDLAADSVRPIRPGCTDGYTLWIESIAFSPDGRYLAAGSNDLRIWDLRRGKLSGILR